MKYRPEIDGLRAIAVLPVILFHAGISSFSGGFVGVDIFFVISGYLITSIIVGDIERGSFSFANFYERRARRILPALSVIMLVSIPLAFLWMLPSELYDFSLSLISALLSTSNILFWTESGYFDGAAELKPLLHTWSLGVEEQFYLLFPIMTYLAWKFWRHRLFLVFSLIAFCSLISAQLLLEKNPSMVFYLLPFRAWELLLGALLALYCHRQTSDGNRLTKELSSVAGLSLIFFAIFYFSDETPFPGISALIPVAGTLLMIYGATQQTIVGKILSSRLLVAIGLVSYSAYLWHHLLFASARLYTFDSAHPDVYKGLILVTFLLAFVTWKYIEQPFRKAEIVSRKRFYTLLAVTSLGITSFAIAGITSNGFEEHFSQKLSPMERLYFINAKEAALLKAAGENYAEHGRCIMRTPVIDDHFIKRFDECSEQQKKALVIFGDSHSGNVLRAIIAAKGRPDFIVNIGKGSCRPADEQPKCDVEAIRSFILDNGHRIDRVVFSQSGLYFLEGGSMSRMKNIKTPLNPDLQYTTDTIDFLRPIAESIPTYWLGPWIEPHLPLENPREMGATDVSRLDFPPVNRAMFSQLDLFIANQVHTSAPIIKYRSLVEDADGDITPLFQGECILFRDRDHLSFCGEKIIADKLFQKISH